MSDELVLALKAGLADVEQKLNQKLADHTSEVERYGKASTQLTGAVDELSAKFKEMRDEITELAQRGVKHDKQGFKSSGQEFAASEAYAAFARKEKDKARIEVKNTPINSNLSAVMSDGTTVFSDRRQGIIPGMFEPLTIRSRLTVIPTSSNAIDALRELSWDNAAEEVLQGDQKPESEINFEEVSVPIKTVAHWIKVSNQLLADAPTVAAYIDDRLRNGLNQRVERQLVLGTGAGKLIKGFTAAGNYTAFTPAAGANLADSINKAKYALWAKGIVPDTALVNPADWSAMELARENGTSGAYLYGLPGVAGGMTPFGVQVVLSAHIPQGSFIIGDLRGCATLYQRENITVEMGYVNDDFTRNLVTIRAEERLALSVERPFGILYGDITSS